MIAGSPHSAMTTPPEAMIALMRPRSVAVIGATRRRGAAGNHVLGTVVSWIAMSAGAGRLSSSV